MEVLISFAVGSYVIQVAVVIYDLNSDFAGNDIQTKKELLWRLIPGSPIIGFVIKTIINIKNLPLKGDSNEYK